MDISIKHIADPAAERCGCLVLPVADGGKFCGTTAARLDQAADGQLARLVKSEHFSGAAGKSVLLHDPAGIAAQRLLLLGCGKPGPPTPPPSARWSCTRWARCRQPAPATTSSCCSTTSRRMSATATGRHSNSACSRVRPATATRTPCRSPNPAHA
jgi:leucyl aminopeptidase